MSFYGSSPIFGKKSCFNKLILFSLLDQKISFASHQQLSISTLKYLSNEKIADVVMLVYDAQNQESQEKVEFLKSEINTEQLQGKKPTIFIVENRSNVALTANYSSLKVFHIFDTMNCFLSLCDFCDFQTCIIICHLLSITSGFLLSSRLKMI